MRMPQVNHHQLYHPWFQHMWHLMSSVKCLQMHQVIVSHCRQHICHLFFQRWLLHIIHQIYHLQNLLQEYRNPQPPSHHSHNLNYLHFCYMNSNCFSHFSTFFESHTRTELFPFYKKPNQPANHSSFSNTLLTNFCIRKSPIITLIIIIVNSCPWKCRRQTTFWSEFVRKNMRT